MRRAIRHNPREALKRSPMQDSAVPPRGPRIVRRIGGTLASLLFSLALIASVIPTAAEASRVYFLIPGMSLDSVSLVTGARVSYLVVSHSFGTADSSFVEIRVVRRSAGEFSVEILSSPYPKSIPESMRMKLRISERIVRASTPEEARSCIREVLVRKGSEPYRKPTPEELEELDIDRVFTRSPSGATRRNLGSERVSTPAGEFLCGVVEYTTSDARTVLLGGVKAERVEEERSRLWLTKDIPFWGLARSTIETKVSTSVARGRPSEDALPKTTRTESVILSYRKPRSRK